MTNHSKKTSNKRFLIVAMCRRPLLPPPIQAHIDHLTEQIDDLAVQLAEDRMNYRIARNKVSNFCLLPY